VSPDSGKALMAFRTFYDGGHLQRCRVADNKPAKFFKTGQLVDATPWNNRWRCLSGVVAGAFVIPPVLDLVNQAYGFVGAPGRMLLHPLPAPQAGMISSLAQGVITGDIGLDPDRMAA